MVAKSSRNHISKKRSAFACGHSNHYFAVKFYLRQNRFERIKGIPYVLLAASARLSYLDSRDLSYLLIDQPAPFN